MWMSYMSFVRLETTVSLWDYRLDMSFRLSLLNPPSETCMIMID